MSVATAGWGGVELNANSYVTRGGASPISADVPSREGRQVFPGGILFLLGSPSRGVYFGSSVCQSDENLVTN